MPRSRSLRLSRNSRFLTSIILQFTILTPINPLSNLSTSTFTHPTPFYLLSAPKCTLFSQISPNHPSHSLHPHPPTCSYIHLARTHVFSARALVRLLLLLHCATVAESGDEDDGYRAVSYRPRFRASRSSSSSKRIKDIAAGQLQQQPWIRCRWGPRWRPRRSTYSPSRGTSSPSPVSVSIVIRRRIEYARLPSFSRVYMCVYVYFLHCARRT